MHWIERSAYVLFYISTLKSVKNYFYQYFKDFMKKEVFILHISEQSRRFSLILQNMRLSWRYKYQKLYFMHSSVTGKIALVILPPEDCP